MRCVSWPPLRPVTRGEEGPSPPWGCNRRATKPQAKFGATRRAAGLFRPDFVARSSQIHCGICSSLAPRLGEKSLAANVIVFMPKTTKRHHGVDRTGAPRVLPCYNLGRF